MEGGPNQPPPGTGGPKYAGQGRVKDAECSNWEHQSWFLNYQVSNGLILEKPSHEGSDIYVNRKYILSEGAVHHLLYK